VDRGGAAPVDLALYVRDVLALSVDVKPFVPGLEPPVAVIVPAGVDRAAVAEEWTGWWADILEWCRGEAQPEMADRPALRTALAALTEPAERYRSAVQGRRPTLIVNEVVSELEQELGRRAKPFRFRITEVSVCEPLWEPLTPTHVLASARFADSDDSRPALRETLRPLV
jgi:hypothetical protein